MEVVAGSEMTLVVTAIVVWYGTGVDTVFFDILDTPPGARIADDDIALGNVVTVPSNVDVTGERETDEDVDIGDIDDGEDVEVAVPGVVILIVDMDISQSSTSQLQQKH